MKENVKGLLSDGVPGAACRMRGKCGKRALWPLALLLAIRDYCKIRRNRV